MSLSVRITFGLSRGAPVKFRAAGSRPVLASLTMSPAVQSIRIESPDRQMPKAMCLFGGKTLLNDDAPDLSVVRDNGRKRPDGLTTSRSSLKRVETILKPVIDVVNLHRPLVSEVESKRYFQAVVRRVSDGRRPLAFRHSPVRGFPPSIPRALVLRNSNRHFEWAFRHQVSVFVRSVFGYQPRGVNSTRRYVLKSAIC